jgi:hypothetical protein
MDPELGADWLQLEAIATPQWVLPMKATQQQINQAMRLLKDVVVTLFGKVCIRDLCVAQLHVEFFQSIHKACAHASATRNWQRSTTSFAMRLVRAMLAKLHVSKPVVCCFVAPKQASSPNNELGRLGESQPELMETWIRNIKNLSWARSSGSLRNMFRFCLHKLLPALSISIDNWPAEAELHKILGSHMSREFLLHICGRDVSAPKKLSWLKLFVQGVWAFDCELLSTFKLQYYKRYTPTSFEGDVHRIAKEDLETLYDEAKKDAQTEMMFMTLLTTGMRIGGYANLKIADVATVVDGRYVAKTQGKTMEKGCKMVAFKIHTRVQELLGHWLNKKRGFHTSEYVFPGQSTHRSTHYFRKLFTSMCSRAKLSGKQFHPHALRHCYAHILLELGNTEETVSKLINHACVATTRKHYLPETAVEVCNRSNVPWFPNTEPVDPVPHFLIGASLGPTAKKRRELAIEQARDVLNKLA